MDDEMEEQAIREKIYKYIRQIKDGSKTAHALKRLETIPMTLDRLSETGVGKAVNSLRNHAEHGSYAQRIVDQWKSIARREGLAEHSSMKREPASPEPASPEPEEEEEDSQERYGYEVEEHANGHSDSEEPADRYGRQSDSDRYSPPPPSRLKREPSDSPPPRMVEKKRKVKREASEEREASPVRVSSHKKKAKSEPTDRPESEDRWRKKVKHEPKEAHRSPSPANGYDWNHKVKSERREPSPDVHHHKSIKRKSIKAEPAQESMDPFAAALMGGDRQPSKAKKPRPSSLGGSSSSSYRSASDGTASRGDPYVESPESVLEALGRSVGPSISSVRNGSASSVAEVKSHAAGRRTGRTKMFAGRKKTFTGEIPTLFQMCIRVCQDNLDMIQETWPLPFDILRPILEKCNETQLARIEQKNEYLEEDTDCLWERHVQRVFPREEKMPYETWKECFNRLVEEREERLRRLSKKINKHAQEQAAPQRKALLADPIAPRNARKAQIRNGIVVSSARVPTASELSHARRQIFESGNSADLRDLPLALRHTSSSVGGSSKSGPASSKPGAKRGALMMKTLKMLGQKRSK